MDRKPKKYPRYSADLPEGILFTDFYELTMAQLYFKTGIHKKEAQFDYFFRTYPDYGGHQAGYCVFAGMGSLLDWLKKTVCRQEDIEALRYQKSASGERMFHEDFLSWFIQEGDFNSLKIEAVFEGRVVHPNTPIVSVRGPLAIAQLLETVLLNRLNHETLIATKASRIAQAAAEQPVIDFGMRRGNGVSVNQAVRAALIGGVAFSSNTGASCVLGYPPKGTHAHSMIQAFLAMGKGEIEAFEAYAQLYPDDCILLVDTINTLESGIPNAIRVFKKLKQNGHRPRGIRLDSGDLAYLSIQAHKMLNKAGFSDLKIVLSNQLNEIVISQICRQIKIEAASEGIDPNEIIKRLIYGVGTSLITSKGYSALDGVYKLTAFKKCGDWTPAVKMSESSSKVPHPGTKKLWRIYDRRNKAAGDLICLSHEDPREYDDVVLRHPLESGIHRTIKKSEIDRIEPLLEKTFIEGESACGNTDIETMRDRNRRDLEMLDAGVKRLINPHIYHVSLSDSLWKMRQDLIHRYCGK